jgi:hypothetical protein
MVPRTTAKAVPILMVVVLLVGCGQAVVSEAPSDASVADDSVPSSIGPSASAPASSAAASGEPSAPPSLEPSPTLAAQPSPTARSNPTPEPVVVRFVKVPGRTRWGDPPFKVKAQASSGARIRYSATGSCTIGRTNGTVEIKRAGSCTVTAQTRSGTAASATLAINVRPARPKIQFPDRSPRWERPFAYTVKAKVSPTIPLKYTLVAAGSGDDCRLSKRTLTLAGRQPNLEIDCRVKVSAAQTSPNFEPPKPVTATIHVRFPSWDVEVISPDVVHFSVDGYLLEVTVRERSGDTLGITTEQTGGDGFCSEVSSTPQSPDPGTTTYVVVLELSPPESDAGYVCEMTARALPPDYFDPGGTPSDSFRVTVLP